jgi:peptide/nickel transport system ATP-binding protein
VPAAGRFPRGCPFRDRCPRQVEACVEVPATTSEGLHAVACWNPVPVPVGRPASVAGRERP